ncbi:MAG: PfkB family carbohydrate kinase [Anaerolineales bacterium]
MSILVVGSVALDSVETPKGKRERTLGGACTYFSAAASLYTDVRMVAVVGEDFDAEHLDFFASRSIDTSGLQRVPGRTFYWAGRYRENMDECETLDTQLNVFADFHPAISAQNAASEYVFLANIDPDLQIEVLQQMRAPRLTALDSMNFWITSKRESLTRAMSLVDLVLFNESEVRLYTQRQDLLAGAEDILALGPKAVIIKRGEHGSMLVTRGESVAERYFLVPAFPTDSVIDPTGAGDTFAAGVMGYLAETEDLSLRGLRRAVVHGTVVASFTVQDFSIDQLRRLDREQIDERYRQFCCLTYFDSPTHTECAALSRAL